MTVRWLLVGGLVNQIERRQRTIRAILGFVILAVAPAGALDAGPAAGQPAPAPEFMQRFQSYDKNHDGRIDREEFQQWMVEVFYFRDTARKGYLTLEDLRRFGVSSETFKAINRKGDGKLTLEEFLNATFRDFEAADTLHDGLLTPEELQTYLRRTGP